MPRSRSRLLLLLPLLALAPLLSGCRYNFAPPIPKTAGAPLVLPIRITEASLRREGDKLRLSARVQGQFAPGYLKVNWFNDDKKLGEDSIFLDAGQRGATFELTAPDKGAYRATLSFGGDVLRQLELYEVQP